MANNCYYQMQVYGRNEDVEEFIRAMRCEKEYVSNGVGRVYECNIDEVKHYEGSPNSLYTLYGDCAWSVISSMRQGNENDLVNISKRLGLAIEVYSEEVGFEFQEHFIVVDGEVCEDECVDYFECDIEYDGIDDYIFEEKVCIENGVTKENYMDFIEDGYLRVGGFKGWDFNDMFLYSEAMSANIVKE